MTVRVVVIGVGHVFHIGPQVRSLILEEGPGAVGLELDEPRLAALLRPGGPPTEVPPGTSSAYRRLAEFQTSVARQFGVPVGSEMRSAYDAAREIGAEVALIDLSAERLVARIRHEMALREKLRFMAELLRARFARSGGQKLRREIAQLEADPGAAIAELGRRFPTIKRILLEERDAHMAGRVRELAARHERVVAVVGDGHVPGLVAALGELRPVVHRLRDLRRMKVPGQLQWSFGPGGASLGFAFDHRIGPGR